jgi:hypothetical protein
MEFLRRQKHVNNYGQLNIADDEISGAAVSLPRLVERSVRSSLVHDLVNAGGCTPIDRDHRDRR